MYDNEILLDDDLFWVEDLIEMQLEVLGDDVPVLQSESS